METENDYRADWEGAHWREAIRRAGTTAAALPEAWRTYRGCLAFVEADGLRLGELPEALRTTDICVAACRQNRAAFDFVPDASLGPTETGFAFVPRAFVRQIIESWDTDKED
jgi:hypothetical protein